MMPNLDGRVAAITGASRGIGYAIAEGLLRAGASVALCARNADALARATQALASIHGAERVWGRPTDVRLAEDVRAFVDGAAQRFGGLDILVNNAGIGGFAPIDEMDLETWEAVLATNLHGAFYAVHAAIPHLKRCGGGWILNIGSLAGRNPIPKGAAYNASKFGLLGFSEAIMLDLRQYDIRVSCIMPGSVRTEFSGPGGAHTEREGDWQLHPEDIAQVVLDLLAFPSRALPSKVEIRPTKPPAR